ncbi:MAG: bifunctional hydroxymethylpyrimidine kinase/phosphomethylpyrimidine kinase [Bacteroidales bacterium]|nr:bifunctional hydroxymethylpyrimidine kinase/phosphomethylpyrimidine kinase [Bacteroidales bacterium]
MKNLIPILSITGSDSTGGSGIQADVKTISSLGGYAVTAITAITVQNYRQIVSIKNIDTELVLAQIKTVFEEVRPKAVKVGLVREKETVKKLSEEIIRTENIVVDAGFLSSRDEKLVPDDVVAAFVQYIFPITKVLIIKCKEAEELLKTQILTAQDMHSAASKLLDFGAQTVLLQGGHCAKGILTDIFVSAQDVQKPLFFTSSDTSGWSFHGVVGTLSSAVATYLASGDSVANAVKKAHDYIRNLVVYSVAIDTGNMIRHFHNKNVSARHVEIYNKMMSLVAENYRDAKDVNFYAERLNITPRYLSSVIAKVVNESPKQLIDNYITKEIEETLLSTPLSLQEVAYQFGFASQVAFCKFFMRQKGVSAKEFRMKGRY